MTSFSDEAMAVAAEHFLWAKEQRMTNVKILRSVGLPALRSPNDRTTVDALKRTWLALQAGWSRPYPVQPRNPSRQAAE